MHKSRILFFILAAALPALVLAANDPLAAEIERWSAFLRSDAASHGIWAEVKQGGLPVLASAGKDLRDGRRLLALHRFAMLKVDLSTAAYVSGGPADRRKDMARLEAEWTRLGKVLHASLGPPAASALAGVRPAALRALGEVAVPQVREYYVSSLDQARSTSTDEGLLYMGTAVAEQELADFCRKLSIPSKLQAPPLRPLRAEVEKLQSELLKRYRPPTSVDRHSAFITANATLKEVRELDAAGLRYGAMQRYLDAVQMVALLRPAPPKLAPDVLRKRLRDFDARLSAGNADHIDHSIARMALEGAQDEVANARPDASPAASTAIVTDVLPGYFAALGPAPPEPPRLKPQVTVTLVRWPYT
jgi:hypothetical protein